MARPLGGVIGIVVLADAGCASVDLPSCSGSSKEAAPPGVVVVAPTATDPASRLAEARKLLASGKGKEAVKEGESLISAHPEDDEAWDFTELAAIRAGVAGELVDRLSADKAIGGRPERHHVLRGVLAVEAGRFADALTSARALEPVAPGDAAAIVALAVRKGAPMPEDASPAVKALIAASAPDGVVSPEVEALPGWRVALVRAEILLRKGDVGGAAMQVARAQATGPRAAEQMALIRIRAASDAQEVWTVAETAARAAAAAGDATGVAEILDAALPGSLAAWRASDLANLAEELRASTKKAGDEAGAARIGAVEADAALRAGQPLRARDAATAALAAPDQKARASWALVLADAALGDADGASTASAALAEPRASAAKDLVRAMRGEQVTLPTSGLAGADAAMQALLGAGWLDSPAAAYAGAATAAADIPDLALWASLAGTRAPLAVADDASAPYRAEMRVRSWLAGGATGKVGAVAALTDTRGAAATGTAGAAKGASATATGANGAGTKASGATASATGTATTAKGATAGASASGTAATATGAGATGATASATGAGATGATASATGTPASATATGDKPAAGATTAKAEGSTAGDASAKAEPAGGSSNATAHAAGAGAAPAPVATDKPATDKPAAAGTTAAGASTATGAQASATATTSVATTQTTAPAVAVDPSVLAPTTHPMAEAWGALLTGQRAASGTGVRAWASARAALAANDIADATHLYGTLSLSVPAWRSGPWAPLLALDGPLANEVEADATANLASSDPLPVGVILHGWAHRSDVAALRWRNGIAPFPPSATAAQRAAVWDAVAGYRAGVLAWMAGRGEWPAAALAALDDAEHAAGLVNVQPPRLETIRNTLDGEALLSFRRTPTAIEGLVVTTTGGRIVRLRPELANGVRDYLAALRSNQSALPLGNALRSAVIDPAMDLLLGIGRYVVVGPDPVGLYPVPALPEQADGLRYLAAIRNVAYLEDFDALVPVPPGDDAFPITMLAMCGDPDECAAVQRVFGDAKVFSGAAATLAAWHENAPKARYIHIGGLPATPDGGFRLADGTLTLGAIAATPLTAQAAYIDGGADSDLELARIAAVRRAGVRELLGGGWARTEEFHGQIVVHYWEGINQRHSATRSIGESRILTLREGGDAVRLPTFWGGYVPSGLP